MLNEKSDVNYWGPKLATLEIRLKRKSHEKNSRKELRNQI